MKIILGSQFWNQEIESTRSLEAVARTLPNEPPPFGITQGSKVSRSQQLLLFQRLYSVPATPSYVVDGEDGGWVLDRVLASIGGGNWWATLTGRMRLPRRVWAPQSGHVSTSKSDQDSKDTDLQSATSRNLATRLLDPSLFAIGSRLRLKLKPDTSVSINAELPSVEGFFGRGQYGRPFNLTGWRGRASLHHTMKRHDLAIEGALHERCVDREGCYWDVPKTVSLDMSSHGTGPSGLRYRFGVHHSSGQPQACEAGEAHVRAIPRGALPGTRAQAAISLEREKSIWKVPCDPRRRRRPYNLGVTRPCITVAAMIGGLLSAKLGQSTDSSCDDDDLSEMSLLPLEKPFAADMFACLGLTAQLGRFERPLLDHTLVSLHLDCGAASAFAAAASKSAAAAEHTGKDSLTRGRGCPTLGLTLQQQIVGPLRMRFDARFAVDPSKTIGSTRNLETTYALDWSLKQYGASRLVCWYTPTRQEAMVELRLLER